MNRAVKRSFHQMDDENNLSNEATTPCSPHRISFLNSHDAKKYRRDMESDANQSVCITGDHVNQSYFNPPSSTSEYLNLVIQDNIPTTKQNTSQCASMDNSPMANLIFGEPKKKEKKFTAAEVQRLINEAVAKREAELREEYDRVLQQLLQQQFESFNNYQQQYVSRHLNKQDAAYIS